MWNIITRRNTWARVWVFYRMVGLSKIIFTVRCIDAHLMRPACVCVRSVVLYILVICGGFSGYFNIFPKYWIKWN